MTIPFRCTSCGHEMTVPDRYAGQQLFCTACKQPFTAPTAAPVVATTAPPPTAAPGAVPCGGCGAPNPSGTQYCGSCGAPIGADPAVLMGRPGVVTLLAVLSFIGAFFFFLTGALGLLLIEREPGSAAILIAMGLLIGGLYLATGIGLWGLKPWGRTLAIVLAILSLLSIPVGTLIGVLVLIYMFSEPAKILFSGRRPEDLTAQECAALARTTNTGAVVAVVAIAAVVFIFFFGIIAAIAIPNLINAIHRGRQKRTMADMRTIAVAIGTYAVDNDERYPAGIDSMDELESFVVPEYLRMLPRMDGWGTEYDISTAADGSSYTLVSLGRDGLPSPRSYGERTTLFDCDIVHEEGIFTQWPEGIQAN